MLRPCHSQQFLDEVGKDGEVEFAEFFSKIKWWSTATVDEKASLAFNLFAGEGVVTKAVLSEIVDHIMPTASKSTVADVTKSVVLWAGVTELLVNGKHKGNTDVSLIEFKGWIEHEQVSVIK